MVKKAKKLPHRLNFVQRLLAFMLTSIITAGAVVMGFFAIHTQKEMSGYVRRELGHATLQASKQIASALDNLTRMMYSTLNSANLGKWLTTEYTSTMEIWQFYEDINEYCGGLLSMDDRMVLVTFYVDNPTISQDKTYIRMYDEFTTLKVFDQVKNARGVARMYAMRDVFSDDYYTYNVYSDPGNLCMLREFSFRGVRCGVVLEFSRKVFTDYLTGLNGHQAYVLDEAGRICVSRVNGQDCSQAEAGILLAEERLNAAITQPLNLGWTLAVVPDTVRLMEPINRSLMQMCLTLVAIMLVMMGLIIWMFLRMTAKVRDLDRSIRSTMAEYGGTGMDDAQEEGDEIDQAMRSFSILRARVHYLMDENVKKEIAKRDAQIRLLYSQIKPHFLYNTLSSVMSLARRYHDERLETMIGSLVDIYRISLNRGKENITIADEMKLTEGYVYIIMNRFDDMVTLSLSAETDIAPSIVPKVILQPFIENAVTHGLVGDRMLHVEVRGARAGDDVVFTIRDDGAGMSETMVAEIFAGGEGGNGFGILNVHQRIQTLYGARYGVSIKGEIGIGTEVTIRLPFCTADQLEARMRQVSAENEAMSGFDRLTN